MARVVRKVSKAPKGAKKNKKLSKKQLIILFSCIALVIVAAVGIILGIYFANKDDSEDDENKPDYFLNASLVDESYDVKFRKSNAAGVDYYANNNNTGNEPSLDYVFVFAYDSTAFYPVKGEFFYTDDDDNEVDKYVESHAEVFKKLVNLQKEIDALKKSLIDSGNEAKAKQIELFIVDTSVGNNNSIYSNSNLVDDSNQGSSVCFSIIVKGEFLKEVKISGTSTTAKETLYGITYDTLNSTVLNNATNYVKNNLTEELK